MEALAFTLTYIVPAAFAATGAAIVAASALKAAGRNPEKINDLRTMMVLGISFVDHRFRCSDCRKGYVVAGVHRDRKCDTVCGGARGKSGYVHVART